MLFDGSIISCFNMSSTCFSISCFIFGETLYGRLHFGAALPVLILCFSTLAHPSSDVSFAKDLRLVAINL